MSDKLLIRYDISSPQFIFPSIRRWARKSFLTWPPPRSFLSLPDDGNYLCNKCVFFHAKQSPRYGQYFVFIAYFNFLNGFRYISYFEVIAYPPISFIFIECGCKHIYNLGEIKLIHSTSVKCFVIISSWIIKKEKSDRKINYI